VKHDNRPDLRASGRILLAALGAAVPTLGLIQLGGAGVGVVNLIVGGLAYLAVYLTLAPIQSEQYVACHLLSGKMMGRKTS
jgi:hypothetical protein